MHDLVAAIERLKPFPDVVPALEKLRAKGYRLAILSNGDPDMLTAAAPHIGFAFDHVIYGSGGCRWRKFTPRLGEEVGIHTADRDPLIGSRAVGKEPAADDVELGVLNRTREGHRDGRRLHMWGRWRGCRVRRERGYVELFRESCGTGRSGPAGALDSEDVYPRVADSNTSIYRCTHRDAAAKGGYHDSVLG